MSLRFYDLSHKLGHNMVQWPSPFAVPFQVTRLHYHAMHDFYAVEYDGIMHRGTHMDTPAHVTANTPFLTAYEPWRFFGTGVAVSIPKGKWGVVTPDDLERAEPAIRPGDIVMINTGSHQHFGDNDTYYAYSPGLYTEAAQWLVDRQVKLVGVDVQALDHPLGTRMIEHGPGPTHPHLMAEYRAETGRDALADFPDWEPAHKTMLLAGIPGIENIGGELDSVTGKRCTFMAFPWRFPEGDGCPVRVVAVIDPEQEFRIPGGNAAMTQDPRSLFRLSGQSIVITGASGALGSVVAEALGALGAKLTLASGSAGALAGVAGRAREAGGEVATVTVRPDSEADVAGILDAAITAFGTVDSIFVASGLNKPSMIEEQSYAEWQQVMDANVRGPWLLARAFGRHVTIRGGRGKLVLVSSVRGRHGHPAGYSAYCTAKGAVDALTRTLATEWGPRGINVNAIAPAVFPSALTEWIFADTEAGRTARARNLSRIPAGRLGAPEDFIGAAVYLLSAASDWVTGQILYVDGGYTAS